MLIPQISGEWRTLLKPRRYGKYVNDHTLFYDDAGKRWCLAGITSKKGNPNDERYFVFADTPSLDRRMRERAKIIDNGTRAWAPCVIKEKGLYYMFYGPSPAKLEVSHDLGDWFGQEIRLSGNPPMACHRDHFVLRRGDNDFIMYVSGLKDGKSAVSCLVSNDLLNWDFAGFALTSGEGSELNPSWGAFESPFVVFMDGLYYLFTTYTDCSRSNYCNTLVFCSENPLDFGCYKGSGGNGALPAARLKCHAPEVVRDQNGWHITTCGWKRSSFARGRVLTAPLEWREARSRAL